MPNKKSFVRPVPRQHAPHAPSLKRDRGRYITRDPAKLPDEMINRMLASKCGLYRVCAFRICRRHKRCFGADVACLKGGLAEPLAKQAMDLLFGRKNDKPST